MNSKLFTKASRSVYILISIVVLVFFIVAIYKTLSVNSQSRTSINSSLDITKDISYFWTNSSQSNSDIPFWLSKDFNDKEWKNIKDLKKLPTDYSHKEVIVRIKLPTGSWPETSISFKCFTNDFDVYIDTIMIYTSSDAIYSQSYEKDFPYHLIQLPYDFSEKYVYFAIRSNFSQRDRFISEINVGAKSDLVIDSSKKVSKTLKDGIYYFVLSALFIFIGILLVLMYFYEHNRQLAFLFLGSSSIYIGMWTLFENNIIFIFLNDQHLATIISTISIEMMPFGFLGFVEEIFIEGRKLIFKLVRWSFVLWAVITLILDMTHSVSLQYTIRIFHFMLAIPIALIIITVVSKAIKGNSEAKIYSVAFTVLSISGIIDIINMFYTPIPFINGMYITPWAMFVFVILLLLILALRIENMNKTLIQYSDEIITKNIELNNAWEEIKASRDEISKWNKTLESKVHKRTEELQDANAELTALNEELTATMEDLQQAQAQLILSDKMAAIGNLVAGVAHEINTPLATINSNIQMETMMLSAIDISDHNSASTLKEGIDPLNEISREALSRINEIVKSLKNFARLDEAELKEVNVHDGIDSTLSLVKHEFGKRINLVKEYGQLPPVVCYPQQLNQVFLNILVNAIQAIEGEGEIRITTEYADSTVYIHFQDSGSGISPDKIEHVFDPGFTTKGVGVGTGLGLSISYKIIQKHHGNIKVSSTLGKGTKFTIELPVSAV